jgi:hypothetical protein
MRNWLKLGDYNAICDSCGRKYKASTMKKRWDGLFVCENDYEIRHPQLSLRVRGDKMVVPIPRPDDYDPDYTLVCYIWDSSGYAGLAQAGCMIAGNQRQTAAFLYAQKNERFT